MKINLLIINIIINYITFEKTKYTKLSYYINNTKQKKI
jgi:hypothetical protein